MTHDEFWELTDEEDFRTILLRSDSADIIHILRGVVRKSSGLPDDLVLFDGDVYNDIIKYTYHYENFFLDIDRVEKVV